MNFHFRNSHLFRILESLRDTPLPVDSFLRKYFRLHHSLGSHDRRYITDAVYKMTRWKSLITFLSPKNSTPEDLIGLILSLDPSKYLQIDSIPLDIRLSFPKEYLDLLIHELGMANATKFCLVSNEPAPTTIRANPLKTTREELFAKLKTKESIRLGASSPHAIHFNRRVNFLTFPEFKEGLFEVQDEGSQLAADLVDVQPGQHLLDYCAGSGGKTLAVAHKTKGKGQIYLHDIRSFALEEAKKRLKRAGIQNAQIIHSEDLPHKNLKGKLDWVLVDAPCSGSGTLRRNPDMKWRFSLASLEETIALQKEVFLQALSYVKKGGHIVYATCSVLPLENEKQVAYFLANHPLKNSPYPSFSSFPMQDGMDGFYAAVLQKC